jgi:hypothetical protein
MAVQINEVIVRAIITGDETSKQRDTQATTVPETVASVSKDELLELIDEVIISKKER